MANTDIFSNIMQIILYREKAFPNKTLVEASEVPFNPSGILILRTNKRFRIKYRTQQLQNLRDSGNSYVKI